MGFTIREWQDEVYEVTTMDENDMQGWKNYESCPTCGNTDKTKINRVFNGYKEVLFKSGRNPIYHKVAQAGCGCKVCGATWHQQHDLKREQYRVASMIKEGDVFSSEDSQ